MVGEGVRGVDEEIRKGFQTPLTHSLTTTTKTLDGFWCHDGENGF